MFFLTVRSPAGPAYEILDVHLHWPPVRVPGSPYTAWDLEESDFIAHLGRCGIRRGVVHAVALPGEDSPEGFRKANRQVLRLVDRYRGRFTAACAVDLRFVEESLREMEAWKRTYGMVWVGEIFDSPEGPEGQRSALDRILREAEALSLVVTVDTTPERIQELRERHRSLLVFPRLERGPAPQRIEALRRGGNLYLDLSPRGYERMGLVELAVEKLGPEHVLFGSNFPVNDPAAVIARLENAFLPSQLIQALFARSAEALLRKVGWNF